MSQKSAELCLLYRITSRYTTAGIRTINPDISEDSANLFVARSSSFQRMTDEFEESCR